MLSFVDPVDSSRDVLVTGIGLVTPLALSREESWRRLLAGDRAGRDLTSDDIDHFNALQEISGLRAMGAPVDHEAVRAVLREQSVDGDHWLSERLAEVSGLWLREPMIAMTIAAACEAIVDAGIAQSFVSPERVGCIIGASKGGLRSAEQWVAESMSDAEEAFYSAGPRGTILRSRCDVDLWPALQVDAATRAVAAIVGAGAVVSCPVAACASGLVSVLQGAAAVHSGQCDVCFVGSSDAALRASVLTSFHRLRVTSRREDGASACRPFDQNRDGFVIGEGAAVMVLESRRHAEERRSARSYGRVAAGGWLSDPTGMTQIDTSGAVVAELLRRTLNLDAESLRSHQRIDAINLHGTATESNDLAEANGLGAVFGSDCPPCTAIKGAIGHLLGAAGSVESAFSLLSLRDQILPGTTNLVARDLRFSIPLSPKPQRSIGIQRIAKLSLGFGGHIACGVFDR